MPQLSIHSPIGPLTISEENGEIVSLDWGWGRDQHSTPVLVQAASQLNQYLDGTRTVFVLPLRPAGSPYRLRVWSVMADIPFGHTLTYQSLASAAGGVARSIGQACGSNPIPILLPCHRVVGAQGVGGYSGGSDPDIKAFLLDHEHRILTQAT